MVAVYIGDINSDNSNNCTGVANQSVFALAAQGVKVSTATVPVFDVSQQSFANGNTALEVFFCCR
jgi:hypothetical protein